MNDKQMVDLRSDTVTKPSPEMRRAMAEAAVGDDVFGDDPTINLLQEKVAELLGKEAALYVPSGSMANSTAIRAQTQPGEEIIARLYGQARLGSDLCSSSLPGAGADSDGAKNEK